MRLIDANEIRIKPEYMHDICGSVMIRVEDVARIINEMPTIKPEPHWILCTPETMPKKDGEYLVTFEEGYADDYNLSLVGIAPFEVDCEGFGFWKEHFDFASMGSLGSDWEEIPVVAWQSLPEPYREEGEEE